MDWNVVLGQMGWSGILAGALVYVFKLYTKVQDKQIDILQESITRLVKRADSCEADRTALHNRLENLLQQGITD